MRIVLTCAKCGMESTYFNKKYVPKYCPKCFYKIESTDDTWSWAKSVCRYTFDDDIANTVDNVFDLEKI